ncbi:antitoxin CptB [Loktanella fryxellensis]|uniref:FAD assembly factor SdhE n=1 Tax=Loktanella fryxellensis TaxID=245187 RepID=A0A1H8JU43_9RHOB|nr:succinate dehydrogenase assembly factor 2 [Loktanella fryxellensis]SEN84111.1 antitoxin CptB [Loktanella fryxellensis]
MTEAIETTRKRLIMRSMRRGIKEMDLILSNFASRALAGYDADALQVYEDLLEESDLDLYRWVSGQQAAPAPFAPLVADIAKGATGLTRPHAT